MKVPTIGRGGRGRTNTRQRGVQAAAMVWQPVEGGPRGGRRGETGTDLSFRFPCAARVRVFARSAGVWAARS